MNEQAVIQNASPEDIPLIREIAAQTWPVAYGHIITQQQLDYMMDMMYSTEALQKQMDDGHCFFMAWFAGQAVGYASVSSENNNCSKLQKLYVLPTVQKSGAGKALLQHAISFARQQHSQKLLLQVNRNNNAVGFYKKNGFVIEYEADFEIGNGFYMNDYVMGLQL